MHVTEHYTETLEYQKLCQHMLTNNTVILKGPPGKWKSQHAFNYAQRYSKKIANDQNSLIWQKNLMNEFLRQLNQNDNICVIVTTSESLSPEFEKLVIEFQGMTETEAVKYLNVDILLNEKAKELAKRLGYLPDGLAFARTHIQTTDISVDSYLGKLENITSSGDSASKKACQMLILQAEKNMSAEDKTIFYLMPYLNTDKIPIFIFETLLPNRVHKDEKTTIIDGFLVKT
ncbi:Hypothetical predicted protein [Mytilus galloprovincialis]|uniref:Uncharacterized protein n=1 Tax=Mytilus galloprovincialis TaxID=29158 RepID=A0A8B6GD82_MYTGA|nr:Hypothetical predicted protein [Mytilus galloprovincialis]